MGTTQRASDDFETAVRATILQIPKGVVATYGEIAAESGFPGAARAVGNVLRTTDGLPWWRVVASSGRLVPGMEAEHSQYLRSEGVRVVNGRVQRGASS